MKKVKPAKRVVNGVIHLCPVCEGRGNHQVTADILRVCPACNGHGYTITN